MDADTGAVEIVRGEPSDDVASIDVVMDESAFMTVATRAEGEPPVGRLVVVIAMLLDKLKPIGGALGVLLVTVERSASVSDPSKGAADESGSDVPAAAMMDDAATTIVFATTRAEPADAFVTAKTLAADA